jgi:hypothetical protein
MKTIGFTENNHHVSHKYVLKNIIISINSEKNIFEVFALNLENNDNLLKELNECRNDCSGNFLKQILKNYDHNSEQIKY